MAPISPICSAGLPRLILLGGQSLRSGLCASRVWITGQRFLRNRAISRAVVGTMASSRATSLPRLSPKPPFSMKSRCMSITTSAVASGAKS